jgi:hypothetical protein
MGDNLIMNSDQLSYLEYEEWQGVRLYNSFILKKLLLVMN